MRMTVIHFSIGDLATIPKGLKKRLVEIEMRRKKKDFSVYIIVKIAKDTEESRRIKKTRNHTDT